MPLQSVAMRLAERFLCAAIVCAAIVAGALVATASAAPSPAPDNVPVGPNTAVGQPVNSPVITVPLGPNGQNAKSGKATATLVQRGKNVLVTVKDPELAHATRDARIVSGTCARSSKKTKYKLAPVVNGTSHTTLRNVDLQRLIHDNDLLVISGSTPLCGQFAGANKLNGSQI